MTTDRVLGNDQLSKLIATADHGIDIGKLAVGKTARSEMAKFARFGEIISNSIMTNSYS